MTQCCDNTQKVAFGSEFNHQKWFGIVRRICNIKSGEKKLCIPIVNDKGCGIGHLEPITALHLQNEELLKTFVRWRNQNRVGYLDQRPVTMEGTRLWLIDIVANPARVAYLIYCGDRLVGRTGFVKLKPWELEADSLVRGEHGGGILFMHWAQVASLIWTFASLSIQFVVADIVSVNELAIENCHRLGYDLEPFLRRPLYRTIYPEGEFWEPRGGVDASLIPGIELHSFRLREKAFYQLVQETPALVQLEFRIRELVQQFDG